MRRKDLMEVVQFTDHTAMKYHVLKTGLIPSSKRIIDYNKTLWNDLITDVKNTYLWNKEDNFKYEVVTGEGNNYFNTFLHLEGNITLGNPCKDEAELLFDSESNKEILEDLLPKFSQLATQKSTHSIGLIQDGGGYLKVKFFDYSLPKHSIIDYLDDSIRTFHQTMVGQLNASHQSGLYLLYGQAGTGKTSFIKDVLSKTTREALFISPSFTEDLTSPQLISLLMDYPDSILVIEDAESVLMEREADNSSAVSNLLNLTDGFLADFLNMNIICTFNTKLKNIDEALLRNGRLKGMHEFTKIEPNKAQQIAALLERDIKPEKPMTIAEICSTDINSKQKMVSNGIGFK